MISWTLIGAGLVGLELINYFFYRKTLTYAEDKKKHSNALITNSDCGHEWMEKFWLENLTEDELRDWIKNTISYNSNDIEKNKYYASVPFDKLPKNKILKWLGYHMYFESFKALNESQRENTCRILGLIENKINFKFDDIDVPDIYYLKFGHNKLETTYKPLVVYSSLNIIKIWLMYIYDIVDFKNLQREIQVWCIFIIKNILIKREIHAYLFMDLDLELLHICISLLA